ncbi:DUF6161 domain-containing protein [Pacificoceanicola onchidii]|uniref:DUF6161 domain-containing protein n=1 Tax=Pacificoceanicola onchidii TaxID=2562685 RepID=UPI0010A3C741|nr:DUF6161 domain-containing protein [Pacificoceanicola onchidii]
MANEEYRIHYEKREDVVFPSKSGMKRYLSEELKRWIHFLDHMREGFALSINAFQGRRALTPEQQATAFNSLMDLLEYREEFNRRTVNAGGGPVLPPPSDSLEGQLILGLFEGDRTAEAMAVYVYFVAKNSRAKYADNDQIGRMVLKGRILADAATVTAALPYSRVSSSKMARAVRNAENHVQSLADEVVAAQEINATHESKLESNLAEQRLNAKRINDVVLRLNRRRDRQHKKLVNSIEQLFEERFEETRVRIGVFELNNQRAEEQRVDRFNNLQELFRAQLRLRAPVELWDKRETNHRRNSKAAMKWLLGIGGIAIVFGLSVPVFGGDYIANSFSQVICQTPGSDATAPQGCQREFSAKGPVTITGLLLVMSLLMWMARLQYRVYLSERHLALDASEKKAFAETYLAMKEGKDVGDDSEAIVLASLFRPTQDGIIRDDEAGMDLSAVSQMAKQLSRNG